MHAADPTPSPWRPLWAAIALAFPVLAAVGARPAEAAPAPAAEKFKNWSIEYEPSIEATTNLQQQAGGTPDLVLRNNVEFSYFPAADADNSALFRIQALNSRFRYNPDFDSTFVIATALASRRVVDSMFGYGGYQFLYKQGEGPGSTNRQDSDVFGGVVVYRPLSPTSLVFHGYQFDFMRAAVRETSYQGHSAYLTFRDLTAERWTNTLSGRTQLRLYDQTGDLEWRNQFTGESAYRLYDWWSLVAEAIYLNSTSSQAGYTFSGWNLGLFSRFTI